MIQTIFVNNFLPKAKSDIRLHFDVFHVSLWGTPEPGNGEPPHT